MCSRRDLSHFTFEFWGAFFCRCVLACATKHLSVRKTRHFEQLIVCDDYVHDIMYMFCVERHVLVTPEVHRVEVGMAARLWAYAE